MNRLSIRCLGPPFSNVPSVASQEYIVNVTKPLGIAVEEAADGSGTVRRTYYLRT